MKCGIILFGILIILDFFFEIFSTVDILVNENFDGVYGVIYAILVSVMFVAVVMFLYYFCARDSPSSRAVVPWAFLIAAIVNTLIFFWIIIYITAIYPKDKVLITQYEKNDDHDLQEGESAVLVHYKKQTKANYIFNHVIGPFCNAIVFLIFFFTAKDWVDCHAN